MDEKMKFILDQCKDFSRKYMSSGELWEEVHMLLPIPHVDGTLSTVMIRELPSGQLFIDDYSDTFLHQHLTVDEAKEVAQHCGLHCEACEANPELNDTESSVECSMYCVVERDQLEEGLHKMIRAIVYSHFVLGRRGMEVRA